MVGWLKEISTQKQAFALPKKEMKDLRKFTSLIGIIVGIGFIVSLPAIADTTYVSGHITSDASWTKVNSPYVVEENVYVDSLVTLRIEHGVEVRLDSMKRIEIKGTLNAIGNETDSIIIGALDTTKRWSQLWFKDASAGSLSYCKIEYAGNSAIYDDSASLLVIEYNTITNSFGVAGGICSAGSATITGNIITNNSGFTGGIFTSGSAIIRENIITENSAVTFFSCGGDGGGIWNSGSSIISGNIIEGNSAALEGGGIWSSGSPTITGNTIRGNSASYWDGGGIYSKNGSPIISGNIIEGNSAGNGGGILSCGFSTITGNTIKGNSGYGGGGIYSYGSSIITGNTIIDNFVVYSGGGIRSYGGSSIITGNTISGNSADAGGAIYVCDSFSVIKYNTITDTTASAICVHSDSALIDSNNLYATGYAVWNSSESDIYAYHNYWGTSSNDTIDMKIWDFYDDSIKGIVHYEPFLTEPLEFGVEERRFFADAQNDRLEASPNPFIQSTIIKYKVSDVEAYHCVFLQIYDLSGRLVKTLVNENKKAGCYTVNWDGKDNADNKVVTGIYFYRMEVGNFKATKKLTIIR